MVKISKFKHLSLKLLSILSLTLMWNASSFALENCTSKDWSGHWDRAIQQCYLDRVDFQKENLHHFLSEQEIDALLLKTKQNCTKRTDEFGGEMAKQFYWDCFIDSLQSQIDIGIEIAANNVLAFKSIDWKAINHCKATYFRADIETTVGSKLKGTKGWTPSDFPKNVMNAKCGIVADEDHLVIYEESQNWLVGKHFFYINVFNDFLISIHSQPKVTSTHAQWAVTEFAKLHIMTDNAGCFVSKEIEICFN